MMMPYICKSEKGSSESEVHRTRQRTVTKSNIKRFWRAADARRSRKIKRKGEKEIKERRLRAVTCIISHWDIHSFLYYLIVLGLVTVNTFDTKGIWQDFYFQICRIFALYRSPYITVVVIAVIQKQKYII